MLQVRAPRMFGKVRNLRRLIDYHEQTKRQMCPACCGTARTPDGAWCQSCSMTGIVGGTLPPGKKSSGS